LRLLLDTHALLWYLLDDPELSPVAKAAIESPAAQVYVSAVSSFEIANKHRRGKLPGASVLLEQWTALLAEQQFQSLSLSDDHARFAGGLDIDHRDPFDRMLIAQSRLDNLTLVSNERLFDSFGVSRLW